MSTLVHNMNLNDCAITIEFNWYGEDEPDWDNMVIHALLPSVETQGAKYCVKVNDLISEGDWIKIEQELYWNEKKIRSQHEDVL